jgi:outer membrane lipoprotein SlyB
LPYVKNIFFYCFQLIMFHNVRPMYTTGKSGREIVAAAVGGAASGGMAGLTMGGSLAVQLAVGALAQTAGYG